MSYQRIKELKVQCEWSTCTSTFDDMEEFYQHLEDHFWKDIAAVPLQPGTTVICHWNECNFTTTDGHDLIRHIYFHGFHTKLKWRGYLKHLEANTCECQVAQNPNVIPELPDGFKCCWEDCYAILDIPDKFYDHIREHAIISEVEDIGNDEKGFKCHWKGCNYTYRYQDKRRLSHGRHKLRLHMSTHTQERSYACPWCGNLYVNLTKLIDHFTRQTSIENHTFQCTHCSRTFASERILKDHMRHHVNHYQCPKCAMTCPNPSALKHHMRYKHSNDRPYACEFCEYRSKEPHDLQIHMQFHQSDLSYQCQYEGCDYIVRSAQSLRYHYRVKHGAGDGKLYACHLCDKRYGTGYQLTPHLRKVHNFQWPPGHCRFRYKECEDGLFRLQVFRYESIELTEQRMSSSKSGIEDEIDSSELAHITPSSSTAPARITKAKRTIINEPIVKSTETKKNRKTKKQATRKSPRKSGSAKKTSTVSQPNKPSLSLEAMPDLYINSDECLEAADTLCHMKTLSSKKKKTKRKVRDSDEEHDDIYINSYLEGSESDLKLVTNDEDKIVASDIEEIESTPNRSFTVRNVGVTTRSSSKKSPMTPSPTKRRFVKAKKRLKMNTSENRNGQDLNKENIDFASLKECSVDLVPIINNPVFPNHHKNCLNSTLIDPTENSCFDTLGRETDFSALLENQTFITANINPGQNTMDLETTTVSTKLPAFLNDETAPLKTPEKMNQNVELDQAIDIEPPLPVVGESPNEKHHMNANGVMDVGQAGSEQTTNDQCVEVNCSEMVLDEEGNRTIVRVGDEDYYIVAGTDTTSGGTAYCLVKASDFDE
uniref:zinc finger protein 148-like isoform X1 n=1 Tax=Styela clava TaxID=7725 RepID=UPI001939D1E9|nr:zinc finger protein 148-like isoform X1 [Styela clava]